jgi:4-aminobutyrate aminotransferase-like enzyme
MAPGLQSIALYSGLAMARGRGSRLYDEDGAEYIDFVAGIGVGSVGHCHPHYVETIGRQLQNLTFGSFTTETRARFLELLARVTPPGLTRIQLFSGGAEAVEAALRLAKSATKRFEFVGFTGAFHGKTGGVLPLLSGDFKHHLGPFVPGMYVAPYANCYRCPWKLEYPDCGMACVEELRRTIRDESQGEIGAILIEPIQGTAGNVVPPPGFLPAVQQVARENGALLIADEMLTGFARTGAAPASRSATTNRTTLPGSELHVAASATRATNGATSDHGTERAKLRVLSVPALICRQSTSVLVRRAANSLLTGISSRSHAVCRY